MEKPKLFGARIIGYGKADVEPSWLTTNDQVSAILEKRLSEDELICKKAGIPFTDEDKIRYASDAAWILKRVGISTRYIAPAHIATSDLAASAATNACLHAKILIEDAESFRLATVSPDYPYSPPTVIEMMRKMGITGWISQNVATSRLMARDQSLACSSFGTALEDAVSDCMLGKCRYALVVGADKMTIAGDIHDRALFPLFGDHAAALVIERVPLEESAFKPDWFFSGIDASGSERIIATVGGSKQPLNLEYVASHPLLRETMIGMFTGNQVYEELLPILTRHIIPNACENFGVLPREIAVLIPHQANGRMVDHLDKAIRKIGFQGYTSKTIVKYGNTTGATVPLGIADEAEAGVLKEGDLILVIAMGGGYSWHLSLFRWTLPTKLAA